MNEVDRVNLGANWYLKEQLDFDKRLIRFRYQTLKPHLKGPAGLELGPAEGEMTQFLVGDFEQLTVVDAAGELLQRIPSPPNLVKVCSLFEEFQAARSFDTIVMEHIVEHVAEPVALLRKVREWLKPGGRILVGVPNGHSIHRLVAVKMGLLREPCQLNSRDEALGHRRVYTRATLSSDLAAGGLAIEELGGVFFKPLSNKQIQDHWSEEMIDGFYELGKGFPEHAAELYAVCSAPGP